MNDYKKLLQYSDENQKIINDLYKNQDNDYVKKALEICGFKGSESEKIAVLRRIVDLKTDPLLTELKKKNYSEDKILKIRDEMYDFVSLIHENSHRNLILKAVDNKILNEFNLALISGVHKIGLILNKIQKQWQHIVIDKNSKIFASMSNPFEFIEKNELYQKTPRGEICDRTYGVVFFNENNTSAVLKTYYESFLDMPKLIEEFENLIQTLSLIAINSDEKAYIEYLKKLKIAFACTNNCEVIKVWRDAEMAWMDAKSHLQIGHPLEYYEDFYTHAVALEWDIRLKEETTYDEKEIKKSVKTSFDNVYKNIGSSNQIMHSIVNSNIDKTQLYISTPMIYYGADLEGLFSAQVVPNDEFVSANSGKKIFAFVDHVYESTKAKPFMKINDEIFEKEFLDYTRDILFNKKEIWRQVYGVSTIGHEFGHILFIDEDSETSMNKSGVFKFIEEYKATTGGLIAFFDNEIEELKLPVFAELIKRSVGLISWMENDPVKAYYCEGLIHLTLLFESKALKFDGKKLKVNLEKYSDFKDLCIKNYENLAKIYDEKEDANKFLSKFCIPYKSSYLPICKDAKEFVIYYFDLYKQIGNEISEVKE